MPQGKLKVKGKLPPGSAKSSKTGKKGNRKVIKKKPGNDKKKLQKALESTIKLDIEREIRSRATSAGQSMSTSTAEKKPKPAPKGKKKKK